MSADAPVPVESLLAQRAWVRALAGALVAGEAQADDLAQQAWLEAIERPPAHDGALRAWFAKVLRRRARDAWRAGERRRRRETAVVTRATAPSAESVVAEAEAHRRVVEAVMELDEPYRATVLLRFFEDMTPREIAGRTGVPVDTVKTRLKRGVAGLRERLAREFGSDDVPWHAALLPLARARTTPVAGTGIAAAGGGLLVAATTKTVAVVAAAVVLAGLGVVLVQTWTEPDADVANAPSPSAVPHAQDGASPSVTRRPRDDAAETPAPPREDPKPPAPAAAAAEPKDAAVPDAPEKEETIDVSALTEYTDPKYHFTVTRPAGDGWRFQPRDEFCRIRLVQKDDQNVEWGRIDWAIHDTTKQTPRSIGGLADWFVAKGLPYEFSEFAPGAEPVLSELKIDGREFLRVTARGLAKGNLAGWGAMERRIYMTKCDYMGAGHLILWASLVVRSGVDTEIKQAFYKAVEGTVVHATQK